MTWLHTLISGIFLVASCGSDPEIVIEENAKQQFATLPGKLGITLKNSSGEWHRVIEGGMLRVVDTLPKALPHAAIILREDFDSPPGLPPQSGYVYWGPYLASPNKRYVAAAVAKQRHAGRSPGFVIVDAQANKTIAVLKDEQNRNVDSLAWSPDSKWVAVLMHSSELGRLGRLLLTLTGHASPYMTWYLEVVNLSGDVVAHTKLTDLRGSWGWVVWLE